MDFVWKILEHRSRVKIPEVRPAHDVQPVRPKDPEVNGCVHLLHEASRLSLPPNATVFCPRPDHALHQEFASEGEGNGVESHEGKITATLSVNDGAIGSLGRDR